VLRHPFFGQGLASEGAEAAVGAAFGCLGIERVASVIQPTNVRSISVAKRLGMKQTGEPHLTTGGDRVDAWVLPRHAPAAAAMALSAAYDRQVTLRSGADGSASPDHVVVRFNEAINRRDLSALGKLMTDDHALLTRAVTSSRARKRCSELGMASSPRFPTIATSGLRS